MPGTLESLAVIVMAVLPGALHTWAFEREAGNWGVGLADRVLRFVGITAVYYAIGAFGLYSVWIRVLHAPYREGGTTLYRSLLATGAPFRNRYGCSRGLAGQR